MNALLAFPAHRRGKEEGWMEESGIGVPSYRGGREYSLRLRVPNVLVLFLEQWLCDRRHQI